MGNYGHGRAFHSDFDIVQPPHESGSLLKILVEFRTGGIHISDYHSHRIETTGDVYLPDGRLATGVAFVFDCIVKDGKQAWLGVPLSALGGSGSGGLRYSNYEPGRRD